MAELLTAQSVAKGVQYAPRKVSLVAGLVRGRTVADAMIILEHTPKRAAKIVAKARKWQRVYMYLCVCACA